MGSTHEKPAGEASPFTERSALQDILEWSKKKPEWLRDALRRLVVSGELSAQDIEELEQICLGSAGSGSPLTEVHMAPQRLDSNPVTVTGLHNLVGVNALASGQELTFAASGLTVVYGDNGSGKSGFVRVLKNVCRSRDNETTILRDVSASRDVSQCAHIYFEIAGQAKKYDWCPDHGKHADLSAVSIFDSRSANIQVNKSNNVAYVPFPMEMLNRLGQAREQLQERIKGKIKMLNDQTPAAIKAPSLQNDTVAGAFLHNLSDRSSVKQLESLIVFSDEEESRLASLKGDLAQDPSKAAKALQHRGARLESGLEALNRLVNATKAGKITTLQKLETDSRAASDAVQLASESLFKEAPLRGVGRDVWRLMWEAARTYSDEIAYPDRKFPNPVENERCVLCQQPLGEEALHRHKTFEVHVKGAVQEASDDAAQQLEDYRQELRRARIPMQKLRALIMLLEEDLVRPEIASKVRRSAVIAAWRLRALISGKSDPMTSEPVPIQELDNLRVEIAGRAEALSEDAGSAKRQDLISQYRALKDRKALAEIAEDVCAEIDRKTKIAEYHKVQESCGTATKRSITLQIKRLSDKLVTDALQKRFNYEVQRLDIGSNPIELRKVGDRDAQSFFQVALTGKPDEPIGQILSEGEHRCVALAAFLAELATARDESGIVFDDPMSSLDHIYRRRVAKRLVEESAHRQVIVFTHDLTFLIDLQAESSTVSQKIHYQHVHRAQSKPGHVSDDRPIDAKQAEQMAQALRSKLKGVKGQFDGFSEIDRSIFAKGFIAILRKAWEQGIADLIHPVLSRFNSHIKGSSLHKLAIINEDDVIAVRSARSRLSEELHAAPETINPSEINHSQMLEELEKLEAWLASVNPSLPRRGHFGPVWAGFWSFVGCFERVSH